MQQMNKLVLVGLGKVVFILLPLAFVVYFGCFLVGEFLIAHGLRRILFVPALVSFMSLIYVGKKLLKPTLDEIKTLRTKA